MEAVFLLVVAVVKDNSTNAVLALTFAVGFSGFAISGKTCPSYGSSAFHGSFRPLLF